MSLAVISSMLKHYTALKAAICQWLEDTEHQGYEGQQGHAEPQVGHVVLPLGLGQSSGGPKGEAGRSKLDPRTWKLPTIMSPAAQIQPVERLAVLRTQFWCFSMTWA
ncbi:hypothetical protein F7725_024021 [Dissostichus mawsoni]|uniref:Uncharacterized protein n=1 Tax=Dissostichus mawsoni TaxID=36200 RepID=A0A7J5XYB2_DISMA|nr:hypothetical protein F7725_024021 [Dissostichus mawsoni]